MTGQQERVLVVDDEEAVRNVLRRTLEGAGYQVITAANGQDALEQISQQEIEVVLLDIKMPGMSGTEVLDKLTADWPDICVIMVTAVTDTQTAVEAMKMGAYDYISKPFNQDDLVLKVQRAIERRALQLKNKQYHLELQQSVKEQTEQLRARFTELVTALFREHKLLTELSKYQAKGGQSPLSLLPPELQEPISDVEEFRNAVLRILERE